jgi:ABC-type microcin C transport system permease subunit YejE
MSELRVIDTISDDNGHLLQVAVTGRNVVLGVSRGTVLGYLGETVSLNYEQRVAFEQAYARASWAADGS